MKTRWILPLVALLAVLAGCASTSRVMIGHARPAIAPEQVRVYTTAPARYQEVALLQTQSGAFTYGEQNKMNSVLAKLRKAAAELGANGVLLTGQGNEGRAGGVGVGIGGGRFGGRSHVGGGVGVDISPAQKYASAVAIYVEPGVAPGP